MELYISVCPYAGADPSIVNCGFQSAGYGRGLELECWLVMREFQSAIDRVGRADPGPAITVSC